MDTQEQKLKHYCIGQLARFFRKELDCHNLPADIAEKYDKVHPLFFYDPTRTICPPYKWYGPTELALEYLKVLGLETCLEIIKVIK